MDADHPTKGVNFACRNTDDAGIGKFVLQAQACLALLGGFGIAAIPFRSGGVGHGMAFVKQDDAVEVGPQPVDDLIDAGFLGAPFLRAKRRIGGEEDALGERDVAALGEARQRRDQ